MQQTVEALTQQACGCQQHHGHGQFNHHQVGTEAAPDVSRRSASSFRSPSRKLPDRLTATLVPVRTAPKASKASTAANASPRRSMPKSAQVRRVRHHVFCDESQQDSHAERQQMPVPMRFRRRPVPSPSVTNWRTRRGRDAPRAPRTAISRRRLSERTSSKLDTFTHAISSSKPAPASSTSRIGRTSPTITSRQRFDAATLAAIGVGILLLQLRGNRLHFGPGFLDGNPILESATPVRLWQLRRRSQVPFTCKRRPEVRAFCERELKVSWQHADDGVGIATERYRLPDAHPVVRQTISAIRHSSASRYGARWAGLRRHRNRGPGSERRPVC